MSILYYPGQGSPSNRRPGAAGWTYAFFYRVYQNGAWGPEKAYVQGTNLSIVNTTGSPITITIEYITKVYYGGREDTSLEERWSEVVTLLPALSASFASLVVAPPSGPLSAGDSFTASFTVTNTGIPGVYVVASYNVYDGPTLLDTVPMNAVETSPGLWQTTPSVLPTWETPSVEYRDIIVQGLLYDNLGSVLGAISTTLDDYWRSTVVLPPATDDEFTFEEIMSNYTPAWMHQDLRPGTRHSVRPVAPNVSVDDLYVVDVRTVPEQQPGIILHTEVVPDTTDPSWTISPPVGTYTFDLTALTGRVRSVIVEFTTANAYKNVELVLSMGSYATRYFDTPGTHRFQLQELYDVSIANFWTLQFGEYLYGDVTLLGTSPITITFIGV